MAETASTVPGGDDGSGSSSQVLERKPKRPKITLTVWVKVRGGSSMPYDCDENCFVGTLLQKVKMAEEIRVPVGKLRLFPCESDANDPSKEAFEQDDHVQGILGENSGKAPFYVHYDDDPFQANPAQQLQGLLAAAKYEDALKCLRSLAEKHEKQDDSYCAPFKVKETWKKQEWGEALQAAFQNINFKDTNARAARIVGLHAGTGTGKTHALLEAPYALADAGGKKTDMFIYITYNQDQTLSMDKELRHAKQAILVRVILRSMDFSNVTCDYVLLALRDISAIGTAELLALIEYRWQGFECSFIAVDECRSLGKDAIQHASSALGELAVLMDGKQIPCNILLSALTEDTFTTISGRIIVPVQRTMPDDSANQFIREKVLCNSTDQRVAMCVAIAGNHFRSIVMACDFMNTNLEITTTQLTAHLACRFETTMAAAERECLREFIQDTIRVGDSKALALHLAAEPLIDMNRAVPPVLVSHVFQEQCGFRRNLHPAQKIFECSAFVNAEKQLEHCGMEYDRFRALYGLPVVPHGVQVHKTGGLMLQWFEGLIFDKQVAWGMQEDSLFTVNDATKRVTRTDFVPDSSAYCFPCAKNHPLVDRACVAIHKTSGENCLIIYQDKISKVGFSAAVKSLNKAANMLRGGFRAVLCVAQVLGACENTEAQHNLEHPYLLIRDHEVDTYYTPTFAPALRFVRDRHDM